MTHNVILLAIPLTILFIWWLHVQQKRENARVIRDIKASARRHS